MEKMTVEIDGIIYSKNNPCMSDDYKRLNDIPELNRFNLDNELLKKMKYEKFAPLFYSLYENKMIYSMRVYTNDFRGRAYLLIKASDIETSEKKISIKATPLDVIDTEPFNDPVVEYEENREFYNQQILERLTSGWDFGGSWVWLCFSACFSVPYTASWFYTDPLLVKTMDKLLKSGEREKAKILMTINN
jgi:hypothetical protein